MPGWNTTLYTTLNTTYTHTPHHTTSHTTMAGLMVRARARTRARARLPHGGHWHLRRSVPRSVPSFFLSFAGTPVVPSLDPSFIRWVLPVRGWGGREGRAALVFILVSYDLSPSPSLPLITTTISVMNVDRIRFASATIELFPSHVFCTLT